MKHLQLRHFPHSIKKITYIYQLNLKSIKIIYETLTAAPNAGKSISNAEESGGVGWKLSLGSAVGNILGVNVGITDGFEDGASVGFELGSLEGFRERLGAKVGSEDGLKVGE